MVSLLFLFALCRQLYSLLADLLTSILLMLQVDLDSKALQATCPVGRSKPGHGLKIGRSAPRSSHLIDSMHPHCAAHALLMNGSTKSTVQMSQRLYCHAMTGCMACASPPDVLAMRHLLLGAGSQRVRASTWMCSRSCERLQSYAGLSCSG